mmetsp:Transcript_23595/g.25131  ORF Transcript_23595/g.25131 Transcript_23595/m.25131 type:complete len:291 (-) Transcript_23595:1592-2464(-)
MMTRSTYMVSLLLVVLLFETQMYCAKGALRDNYSEDEYVRQVIEEDQFHYHDESFDYQENTFEKGEGSTTKENNSNNEEEEIIDEEQRRQNEEERLAREADDRLAAKREQQFQADLDRMNDEEKNKALKQKKIDGRKVQSVLKAAKHNNLYMVLGIRNWNLRIPSWEIDIGGLKFTIPGFIIKETSERNIRKQFRTISKQIHPDKNKDGRAQEAFIAAENAAAILSDKQKRKLYDDEIKLYRSNRLKTNQKLMMTTILSTWNVTSRAVKILKTSLGPFFVPVLIICALII